MNDIHPNLSSRERCVLVVLLIAFMSFGLFDHSFWSPNDSREGSMIWDMYQAGRWVTPTLNGVPYLEKPPLLHWTSLVFCKMTGTVHEGLLRLPAALYGLGALWILILWARQMGRERAGFAGAFMCATSFKFMEYSKVVLTDAAVAFVVMASLYLFWKAYTASSGRGWRWTLFILISALAFYAKGLIGPGFIWVSVGLYLLYRREWKLCFLLPLCFLPVFILVIAPWAWSLWKAGGMDFVRGVFWDNQFGRFFSFSDPNLPADPYFVHKEPFYYYLMTLPGALLPWTLVIIPAMIYWFRRRQGPTDSFSVFLRFCVVGMLLVLHASSAKLSSYALPLFPILFLMTALWVDEASTRWDTRLTRWTLGFTAGLLSVVVWLAPIFYFILFLLPRFIRDRYLEGMDIVRDLGWGVALLTLLIAVVLLAYVYFANRRLRSEFRAGRRNRVFLVLPAVYASVLILAGAAVFPIYDYQRSYIPFAILLKEHMHHGRHIVLAVYEEKYIGAFTYYTGRRLETVPFSADLRKILADSSKPIGVLVKTKDLKKHGAEWGLDSFTTVRPTANGYMSDKFRLILNDR
jgi:4-amino-4-deoxy-L-arabinose transferase-like glycosyltransferase